LIYAIYDHLVAHGVAGKEEDAEALAADPRFRPATDAKASKGGGSSNPSGLTVRSASELAAERANPANPDAGVDAESQS